jgi:hypothetical protein
MPFKLLESYKVGAGMAFEGRQGELIGLESRLETVVGLDGDQIRHTYSWMAPQA